MEGLFTLPSRTPVAASLTSRRVSRQQEGLTQDEALEIVKKCIAELHTRFLVSQPTFTVKIVDSNGINVMEM